MVFPLSCFTKERTPFIFVVRFFGSCLRLEHPGLTNCGVANGKCETLRDSETSMFPCEAETLILLKLKFEYELVQKSHKLVFS